MGDRAVLKIDRKRPWVDMVRTGDRWNYGWEIAEATEEIAKIVQQPLRDGKVWIPGWSGARAVSALEDVGYDVSQIF